MTDNGNYTLKEITELWKQSERRVKSLSKAIQKLELQKAGLEHDNQALRNQLQNADQNIAQQKANLINAITESNQAQQHMAQEIQGLRSELRELDGDNHRLGN